MGFLFQTNSDVKLYFRELFPFPTVTGGVCFGARLALVHFILIQLSRSEMLAKLNCEFSQTI